MGTCSTSTASGRRDRGHHHLPAAADTDGLSLATRVSADRTCSPPLGSARRGAHAVVLAAAAGGGGSTTRAKTSSLQTRGDARLARRRLGESCVCPRVPPYLITRVPLTAPLTVITPRPPCSPRSVPARLRPRGVPTSRELSPWQAAASPHVAGPARRSGAASPSRLAAKCRWAGVVQVEVGGGIGVGRFVRVDRRRIRGLTRRRASASAALRVNEVSRIEPVRLSRRCGDNDLLDGVTHV